MFLEAFPDVCFQIFVRRHKQARFGELFQIPGGVLLFAAIEIAAAGYEDTGFGVFLPMFLDLADAVVFLLVRHFIKAVQQKPAFAFGKVEQFRSAVEILEFLEFDSTGRLAPLQFLLEVLQFLALAFPGMAQEHEPGVFAPSVPEAHWGLVGQRDQPGDVVFRWHGSVGTATSPPHSP